MLADAVGDARNGGVHKTLKGDLGPRSTATLRDGHNSVKPAPGSTRQLARAAYDDGLL